MITVIVEFTLPKAMSMDEARATFLSTAPKYQTMPGLIRKYYFISDDGAKAGGIYLWESRAQAEQVYTAEWKTFVRGKYGTDPALTYLNYPVVVDNTTQQIISA